jgi:hypothetical protein
MAEISRNVRAAVREHTSALLSYPNVIGVGAARKTRKGRKLDEYSVVAYVSRKLPTEFLDARHRVPRELELDDEVVSSDVVEIAEPRFLAVDTSQYRPLQGGCQIRSSSGTGTLGAILYDRLDDRPVLLTNNHVLTAPGSPMFLPTDTRIYQPAGGAVVGSSKRVAPMFSAPLGAVDYRFSALVDAGIVEPLPTVGLTINVVELGRHPYVVLPPFEGLEVEHRGYRTQLRRGTVEAIDLTIVVKASNGDGYRIGGPASGFSIRAPERLIGAWPGDSGSLVVDAARGAARGLVFGGNGESGGLTFACELGAIMAELQLETACSGGLSALIRRAVFRRELTAWAAAEGRLDTTGHTNALVKAMVAKVERFRHQYLRDEANCDVSGAVGNLLRRLTTDLAETLLENEDFAGLLDRAFGDWLVLPTVYDMLEYRIPDHLGPTAIEAFRQLGKGGQLGQDFGWVEPALSRCAGLTVRDLLAVRVHAPSPSRYAKKSRRPKKQQSNTRAEQKAVAHRIRKR